jgi:hypothetical protein
MKPVYFYLLLSLSIIFTCCTKENFAPEIAIDEMADTTSVLKFSGDFISGPYGTVRGTAEVLLKGSDYEVMLKDFTSSNGPALHVFLSKEKMPVNYIDLGSLKSTKGNQLYSVKGMPNIGVYQYISIHCVEYNHLFGSAMLN